MANKPQQKPVVEANKTSVVSVEMIQDDIDSGARWYCSCPVSLAIGRTLREKFKGVVEVLEKRINFVASDGQIVRVAKTPKIVYDFIQAYDTEKPVQPISFKLEVERP